METIGKHSQNPDILEIEWHENTVIIYNLKESHSSFPHNNDS